ncbi:hypothetical protein N3930_44775, partial [Bacillus thuringiensis]|nr:hypothetical protein [Bacillus thuringiensis]
MRILTRSLPSEMAHFGCNNMVSFALTTPKSHLLQLASDSISHFVLPYPGESVPKRIFSKMLHG